MTRVTSTSTPRQRRRPLRLLISAGPTREPIDAVRFLSNYSTGTMGVCLATEARRRGHRVTLISGPISVRPPRGVHVRWVERTHHMHQQLAHALPTADVLIMAAAVCDFRPRTPRRAKLPRRGQLRLSLVATPDILSSLPRYPGQLRVGFALEATDAVTHAWEKLRAKHLDVIVGQTLSPSGRLNGNGTSGPFGDRPVNAFLLRASGTSRRLGTISKAALARALLDEIEQLWYGGKNRRLKKA